MINEPIPCDYQCLLTSASSLMSRSIMLTPFLSLSLQKKGQQKCRAVLCPQIYVYLVPINMTLFEM